MTFPLQLSWFFNFVPTWLGPILIYISLPLMSTPTIAGFCEQFVDNPEIQLKIRKLIFLFVLGASIAHLPEFINSTDFWGFWLLIGGQWLSGLTAARFYQRVIYLFSSYDGVYSNRLLYYAILTFIILVGGWIVAYILIFGSFYRSEAYSLALVWTIVTVFTSSLGVYWKFRRIDLNKISPNNHIPSSNPSLFIVGAIFGISGAQIINFEAITIDILASLAGVCVYSIGYWIGFVAMVSGLNSSH